MTITQLEYIVAVDAHRSFVAAANQCFITQPTLSMQIQKLEAELGVRLFDRKKQPVVPTEIGQEVVEQAHKILAEHRRIKEIIADRKSEMAGHLRLGIIPTLAPYLLPLFLVKFLGDNPKVNVSVAELPTQEILRQLTSNLLDCGLMATPLHDPSIDETPLFYEPLVAYISDGSVLAAKTEIVPADIDVNELLLLTEGHCLRSQVVNLCDLKANCQPNLKLEYQTGSIETLKRLVEMNHGSTILPELSLIGLSATDLSRVRRFQHPAPTREISLVTHRSFVKKSLIEGFKQEIIRAVPTKMLVPQERAGLNL